MTILFFSYHRTHALRAIALTAPISVNSEILENNKNTNLPDDIIPYFR
ncbi:hypothetical protein GXM_07267 [Nostoc sphaeroides CCNUC1]|uniref:Uncharacterized protein n=1 Tax=Nostoc sphaeroides CCNUC1 TaxID=2653204 RepID=A0A5P8WAF2_9NOSO|nr:hypothetical protein GXM_07267 [Nostoc sphaeroides CCNUC1]